MWKSVDNQLICAFSREVKQESKAGSEAASGSGQYYNPSVPPGFSAFQNSSFTLDSLFSEARAGYAGSGYYKVWKRFPHSYSNHVLIRNKCLKKKSPPIEFQSYCTARPVNLPFIYPPKCSSTSETNRTIFRSLLTDPIHFSSPRSPFTAIFFLIQITHSSNLNDLSFISLFCTPCGIRIPLILTSLIDSIFSDRTY